MVVNARPIVKPNAGFFRQLITLEKSIFGGKKTVAEEQYDRLASPNETV
jgi:hypothetical protein